MRRIAVSVLVLASLAGSASAAPPDPNSMGKGAWIYNIEDTMVNPVFNVNPTAANRFTALAAKIETLGVKWVAVKGGDGDGTIAVPQLADFPAFKTALNNQGISLLGYHLLKGGNLNGEIAKGQAIGAVSDGVIIMPHDAGFTTINNPNYMMSYVNTVGAGGKFLAYSSVFDKNKHTGFPHAHVINGTAQSRAIDVLMPRSFYLTGTGGLDPTAVVTSLPAASHLKFVSVGGVTKSRICPMGQCDNHRVTGHTTDGKRIAKFFAQIKAGGTFFCGAGIWALDEIRQDEFNAIKNAKL